MSKNTQTIVAVIIVAVAILAAIVFVYKDNTKKNVAKKQSATGSTDQQIIDYSKTKNWLSLSASGDKKVDVFYIYPTAWQKKGDNDPDVLKNNPNICEIDNPSMLAGSKAAFGRQATAFETIGNIYAPYYRQVNAAYSLNLSQDEQDKIIGDIPTADVTAAFDYYIKNYNSGRPFILAGHSQGSNVMLFLLADYMKQHPDVYKNMVAAYVIGYSVTPEYLAQNPHLKFAQGADDTGVIISYNTEAPDVTGKNPVLLPNAIAINPISWSRGEEVASAEKNLGSLAFNKDGTVVKDEEGEIIPQKNYADARVDVKKGVIICSTVDQSKLVLGMGPGIYHSYDYPFYFFNIRENATKRAENFLNKQ